MLSLLCINRDIGSIQKIKFVNFASKLIYLVGGYTLASSWCKSKQNNSI